MPLRDHFRSPLDDITTWESFHAGWPMVIVQKLGEKLPPRFVAALRAHSGPQVEIDVATYDTEDALNFSAEASGTNGGVATAVWAPSQPTLVIEAEPLDADEYEVRIYDTKRGRRLVAAVEIVSPANKDPPEHRRVFVAKCAALLQQRVSVAIVDLVTIRLFNLYAELLELLGRSDPNLGTPPLPLYAVSCRLRSQGDTVLLETWHQPLTLGQPLPTLPLWLTETFAVPLVLEESYEQTCRDLRIP
jgi:hypothetical protein